MDLVSGKLIYSAIIILMALGGGLAPLLLGIEGRQRLFSQSYEFARGVFLGLGVLHLLPDAIHGLPHGSFTFSLLVNCALASAAFVSIWFIEKRVHDFNQQCDHEKWLSYLLVLLLSLHSFLAGVALGIEDDSNALFFIFLAIISHKALATFAMVVSMRIHHFSKKRTFNLLMVFVCMTPLGALVGHLLMQNFTELSSSTARALFDASLAGVFTYLGTAHQLHHHGADAHAPHHHAYPFALGITLMGIATYWF